MIVARGFLAIALLLPTLHTPSVAQDSSLSVAGPLPIAALLDSAEQFLRNGRAGHAEVFVRDALEQRDRATQEEYVRALLILARGLHPEEIELTALRDTDKYPLLRPSGDGSGNQAVVLDLISEGTRSLLERNVSAAQQVAWEAFDRTFQRRDLLADWQQSDASPDLQIRVLELLVGTQYSRTEISDTIAAQRTDGVKTYLEYLIELDPHWTLSPLINWRWRDSTRRAIPSLADLFAEVSETTFGMSARRLYQPTDTQHDRALLAVSIDSIGVGSEGERIWGSNHKFIAVQSNRMVTFQLAAVTSTFAAILDEINEPTDRGVLSVNLLKPGDGRLPQLALRNGEYDLMVTAVFAGDPTQTLQRCFRTELSGGPTIPILQPVIPSNRSLDFPSERPASDFAKWQAEDPSVRDWRMRLKREDDQPSRHATALRGIGLGVSAVLLATVLRNGELKSVVPSDRWAFVVGGTVALSSVVAALTNRPIRNRANVIHNMEVRESFGDDVRSRWDAHARNVSRLSPTMSIGGARQCPTSEQ